MASRIGDKRKAYRVLVGTPERNRVLGRYRRRWDEYIGSRFKVETVMEAPYFVWYDGHHVPDYTMS
jgi:hypothetical protein